MLILPLGDIRKLNKTEPGIHHLLPLLLPPRGSICPDNFNKYKPYLLSVMPVYMRSCHSKWMTVKSQSV